MSTTTTTTTAPTATTTIWDILKDATIVVAHDPWIITWNYSATFSVYEEAWPGHWTEVDVFTCYDLDSVEAATLVALEHARRDMEVAGR